MSSEQENRNEKMDSEIQVPEFLSATSALKPQLDTIFAEVEKSLPNIDFDLSDVSSEEDVPIFQRQMRTPTLEPEVGDLDDSFSSSSTLEELIRSDKDDPVLDRKDSLEADVSGSAGQRMLKELGEDIRPKSAGMFSCLLGPETGQNISLESKDDSVLRFVETSKQSVSRGEVRSGPVPLRNTWVGSEDGDKASGPWPAGSTKRQETTELNTERIENDKGNKAGKTIKKERKSTLGNPEKVVSMFFPASGPVLPLANVNLDALVNRATSSVYRRLGDTLPLVPPHMEESGDMPADDGQGDADTLIQRLATLSMTQSGTELHSIDIETGALKKTTRRGAELKQAKTARNISVGLEQSRSAKIQTACSGTNTSDLANLPRSSLKPSPNKEEDRETVYLDLRGFDKNKKVQQQSLESVQRILRITNSQRQQEYSDSDSEDEELWHEQRRKIKESLKSSGKLPPELTVAENTRSSPVSPERPVRGQTHAQRLAGHLPSSKHKEQPVEEEEEVDISDMITVPPTHPNLVEREKLIRIEAARKLREQKEQERQSRLRLGKHLEALRPTASSRGRSPCAEATPTLFDIESSYEPFPQSLPLILTESSSDAEIILLTIHLSSNGEMIAHRSSTSRNVDGGHGFSASYTTLLTWLLSLVPDDFGFLHVAPTEAPYAPAPFHVLGLQQMYLEGQLVLYVAVTPTELFSDRDVGGRSKKSQQRDELKFSSPFQKILLRYFSVNTLITVCPWIQDLVSLEVSSASLSNKQDSTQKTDDFVYKPPLPKITHKPLSTFVQVNPDPIAAQKVLGIPVGFFWQTVDNEEGHYEQTMCDQGVDYETQNTMSLVYKKVYRDPHAMMGILNRILQEGLDLCGVRLLYPTAELMNVALGNPNMPSMQNVSRDQNSKPTPMDMANNIGPVLAIALRGTFARTVWLDAIGPADPVLARMTDPISLCALYGGDSRDECLLFCPRNPSRILSELSRWFGGRVPQSGVIDVGVSPKKERHQSGSKKTKKVSFEDTSETDIPTHKPPATLTSTVLSDIFIVVSPLVSSKCMGILLSTCQRRGFQLRGVRRAKLTHKMAGSLGMNSSQTRVFSSDLAGSVQGPEDDYPVIGPVSQPCTLLLLAKENAAHNACSLIEGFMVQLSLISILGTIQSRTAAPLTSALLFHAAPFSEGLLNVLGGDFSKVPDPELATTPGYIAPKLYTNPEMEQIVVLTLTGFSLMKSFGIFLGRLLNLVPYTKTQSVLPLTESFELLGLKWLPCLGLGHAKELTPYELGAKEWKPSIQHLTSEPAVILVLRGVNAFSRLKAIIATRPQGTGKSTPLDRLMSPTAELAYRQATLFFQDKELFGDPSARPLMSMLPPVREGSGSKSQTSSKFNQHTKGKSQKPVKKDVQQEEVEEAILKTMLSGPRPIVTILVVKPDVVRKNLGKLLKKINQENFQVVGMRLEVLEEDNALLAVPKSDSGDEILSKMHIDYLTKGASLVLALQRENAVKKLHDLLGPEDPKGARRESSYHWRGVFGTDPISNGLYAPSSYAGSVKELKQLFTNGICCKETEDLKYEMIQCPAVDLLADVNAAKQREVVFRSKADVCTLPVTMTRSSGTSGPLTLPVSSLTQTNCIVLTPLLTMLNAKTKKYPFVEIFDCLLSHGFELVGCRMIWFTVPQAQHYLHLCEAGSFAMVPLLTSGPSIVMAVQRDNAVMAFESLLGGQYDKESVYSRYCNSLLRPKDVKQSCKHLAYFFDKLIPEAHVQILKKSGE